MESLELNFFEFESRTFFKQKHLTLLPVYIRVCFPGSNPYNVVAGSVPGKNKGQINKNKHAKKT